MKKLAFLFTLILFLGSCNHPISKSGQLETEQNKEERLAKAYFHNQVYIMWADEAPLMYNFTYLFNDPDTVKITDLTTRAVMDTMWTFSELYANICNNGKFRFIQVNNAICLIEYVANSDKYRIKDETELFKRQNFNIQVPYYVNSLNYEIYGEDWNVWLYQMLYLLKQ